MLQDVNKQRGAFVEVKGWGDVLEGASRRESRSQSVFHVLLGLFCCLVLSNLSCAVLMSKFRISDCRMQLNSFEE
jgi:hypothetical protein